jgi:hypothetical protein
MRIRRLIAALLAVITTLARARSPRSRHNFNLDWLMQTLRNFHAKTWSFPE